MSLLIYCFYFYLLMAKFIMNFYFLNHDFILRFRHFQIKIIVKKNIKRFQFFDFIINFFIIVTIIFKIRILKASNIHN